MRFKDKGWGQVKLTAFTLCVIIAGSWTSRAFAQEKSAAVSAPTDCAEGNGPPQLLNASAEDALEQSSNDHYTRGLQLYSSGDHAGAEKEFRQAVQERPAHGPFVSSLTKLYIADAQPNAALDVIRDYTKICGVTALGYGLEAEVLFQQRHYDDALAAAVAALKLYPQNARMHQLIGLMMLLHHDKTDASIELQKAEQIDPDSAEIHYYYGRSLYLTGHYPEAKEQFLACLKLDPQYRKAAENLGLSYQAVNDYTDATRYYQQAIAKEKTEKVQHGEPYGYFGAMLMQMGKPQEALPVLQDGVAASPRSQVVNFELGRTLLALNQPGQAQHYLEIAEALDPRYAQTHYLLGRLYNQQKRAQDAEQEFKKFQELDKDPENREFPITDR